MNNDLQDLEGQLNDAKQAREDEAARILEKANIEVDTYDPETDGPPTLPADAADDDSTQDDGSNQQGNNQGDNST